MIETGVVLALLGAVLSILGGGVGMALGTLYVGKTGAGLAAENPKAFGGVLLGTALPSTQGVYGFLGSFLLLQKIGLIGGEIVTITPDVGWAFVLAAIPVAVTTLVSGIGQGKIIQSGLRIVAKDPSRTGQMVILAVLIETIAVFGLLLSILMINGINV